MSTPLHTSGDSRRWCKPRGTCHPWGDTDGVPAFCPISAAAGILGLNQSVKELFFYLSALQINKHNKFIKEHAISTKVLLRIYGMDLFPQMWLTQHPQWLMLLATLGNALHSHGSWKDSVRVCVRLFLSLLVTKWIPVTVHELCTYASIKQETPKKKKAYVIHQP